MRYADVVSFEGIYTPKIFEAGTEYKRMLFMKPDKKLYYPDGSEKTYVNAFRALFQLPDRLICGEPDNENSIKSFVINFDGEDAVTGIMEIMGNGNVQMTSDDKWYDLSGRSLNGRPSTQGMYINNGHKILIKK